MGDLGSIPGLGRSPGEGNGNPLQYSCLENPMDRGLVGYSPRGYNESDTTERLHFTGPLRKDLPIAGSEGEIQSIQRGGLSTMPVYLKNSINIFFIIIVSNFFAIAI